MNEFSPKKLEGSQEILRFLDRNGLMRTLGLQEKNPENTQFPRPTFMLRSLDYYRSLEGSDSRGDGYEQTACCMHQQTGERLTSTCSNPALVSCWSTYEEKDLLLPDPWDTFSDSVAAIVTTVFDVEEIMKSIFGLEKRKVVNSKGEEVIANVSDGSIRSMEPSHKTVCYYDENSRDRSANESEETSFWKRKKYEKETEYRFIAIFGGHSDFNPEQYVVKLKDVSYIKKIYIREDKLSEDDIKSVVNHQNSSYEAICLNIKELYKTKELFGNS